MGIKENVENNVFIYLFSACTATILATIVLLETFRIPYVAGETKRLNRELEDSLQVAQSKVEELRSDTAFIRSERRQKLASLRDKGRTIDTLQEKLSKARRNLKQARSQAEKDSPVDPEVIQRLRTQNSNLKSQVSSLRQGENAIKQLKNENSSLKSKVASLERKNSDLESTIASLREENSELQNVIESLRTQLCKSEREVRKLSGQDKYEGVIEASSPYPSTAPAVRIGMTVSKAQSLLEEYATSLSNRSLTADLKEGAFETIIYHHNGEGNNPQIRSASYKMRNQNAAKSVISQALCAFGREPANSAVQGTKFTWKDIKGHEVVIEKISEHYGYSYQVN